MKTLALLVAALSAVVLADDLKVVNFPNIPQKPRSVIRKSTARFTLEARQSRTDEVRLINRQNLYAINLGVGTPLQNISVQIDTGSSDLWFPVTSSPLCAIRRSQCSDFGSYSMSSTSIRKLNQAFSITYGDGTTIQGQMVTDNLRIGSNSLSAVQFAACSTGSSDTGVQGILGIGYEANEAQTARGLDTYPNLISSMVSQGAINSRAYSMWLNDPDSAEGNVLFGGVDTAKFTGTLVSMPVVAGSDGEYRTLSMPLTAVTASAGSQTFTMTRADFASPALVDSGTTLMYLPDDVVLAIYRAYGVITRQTIPLLPCNYGNDPNAKLTFEFNRASNARIDVLLNDLLAETNYVAQGVRYCEFLLSGGAPRGLIILGDAFMRSAYIVYDLTNNMIAIAQSKFNVTESNIREISSSGIPSASVMSTLVAALQVSPTAANDIPGAGSTAFTTGTASGSVETTASVPSFSVATNGARSTNAAPSAIGKTTNIGVFGVVAATVTLLSVMGGAMIVWF